MARQKSTFFKLLKEHVKFCCGVASMHGLYHVVAKNRNPLERLFWLGLVLSSAYFCISQALIVWEHYRVNPAILKMERDFINWKIEFPSVTICETGFVRNVQKVFEDVTDHKIPWNKSVEDYLRDLAFTDYKTYFTLKEYATGEKLEYLQPDQYRLVVDKIVPLMVGNEGTDSRNWKQTYPLKHDKTPFIRTFTEDGACTTFNPKVMYLFNPRFINESQINYDFPSVLYGPSDEAIFSTKAITGAYKLYIESPNEIIDILSKNLTTEEMTFQTIKFTTTLVLSEKKFLKLNRLQRKCRRMDEAEDLPHSPIYTEKLCTVECRINLCLKHCGCIPYYYRRIGEEKICNLSGLFCLSKFSDEIMTLKDTNDDFICNCMENCDYTKYILEKVSTISWFLDTNLGIGTGLFPITRYKRSIIFSKMDVLSQIGGILGLTLGCSVLSIIEIIYFFTLRFYWGVIKKHSIKFKN